MMKNATLAAFVVVGIAATGTAVNASDYERDGRACLKELCVGDGLDALGKIAWDTAVSPASEREGTTVGKRPVGRGETNRVKKRYRGEVDGILAYLADGRFDSEALAGLAKIEAACETQSLQGTYTTASGNPTVVLLSMTADPEDLSSHRWEVRRISRKIPAVGTAQQAEETKAALEERYAPFTSKGRSRAEGPVDMLQVNNFSGFQFTLSAPAVPNEGGLLKQHPACGGSGGGKVSLD
jgi:hypothetical protein